MESAEKQEGAGVVGNEFPSFIPPLMVKELRRGLRTNGFVLFLILFPLLMTVPFLFQAIWGTQVVAKVVVDVIFWLGASCVFLIFNPLRALCSVSQEKDTRTDELIIMTRLTPFGIVLQKWMSLVVQTALLAVVILPFYLIRYLLGGVEIVWETGVLAALFVASCFLSAVALWVSGMPGIYRVFYALGLAGMGLIVILLTASSSIFDAFKMSVGLYFMPGVAFDSLYGGLILLLWVAFYGLMCRAFLFLASRWFAPISENTEFGLRKTMLWMIALFGVFFVLSWMMDSPEKVAQSNMTLSRSLLMQGIGYLCLLEMVVSRRVKVIHREKLKEKGGWVRRLNLLFLPGWQGAGLMILFTGLVCALLGAICALVSGHPEHAEACGRAVFLIGANYLFLGVVFQPLYQRTGQYALLIYFAIIFLSSVVFSLILPLSTLLPDKGYYMSLLSFMPMGSNLVNEWSTNKAVISQMDIKFDEHLIFWGNWTLITVMFLVFLISAFPFWRKILRLERAAGTSRL